MIKTYSYLLNELSSYKNPKTKIQRMVNDKTIFPIDKGLYETDSSINPFYLAGPIYSPSYISFETALSFYDVIPERVYAIKCATFDKKKKKEYKTSFGTFMYQDVPSRVFAFGTSIKTNGEYTYIIASKEKALLDLLYEVHPLNNMKEMREFLFLDLRINESSLDHLDLKFMQEIGPLYHSRNISLFIRMLMKGKIYD